VSALINSEEELAEILLGTAIVEAMIFPDLTEADILSTRSGINVGDF
jgi:hypothetical protein